MSEFRGLEYVPQDADDEILLSEAPLDVLMESITKQFEDPLEYVGYDFVQSFITKYMLTKDNCVEDEEVEELNRLYVKFISFIERTFQEQLSLGIPELEDKSEEEQLEIIHYAYRFFVINLQDNFQNYIYQYIKENKKLLAEQLPERNDVSTNSLKQVVDDRDDLLVLANLNTAIEMSLKDDSVLVDEFLSLAYGKDNNLENDFITDKFEGFELTGNFVIPYSKILPEEMRIEIECKIRNKLLKKYRKNKQ